MIQHAFFLLQIRHTTYKINVFVLYFLKRFLSAKMFPFACETLPMFFAGIQ